MDNGRKEIHRAWLLILQLGLTGICAIGICIVIGLLLKEYAGIDIMLFMCVFGVVCASASVYRLASAHAGSDDELTRTVEGIYDREGGAEPDNDDLLEEIEHLNRLREAELENTDDERRG